MIPWPLAILALYFGAIATFAAANAWRIATGMTARPLAWQLLWLGLSAGAAYGLILLRPWGRRLAVWTAGLLMVTLLAAAGLFVLKAGQAFSGLLVTCGAALHVLPIRYLQRPAVKAYFGLSLKQP